HEEVEAGVGLGGAPKQAIERGGRAVLDGAGQLVEAAAEGGPAGQMAGPLQVPGVVAGGVPGVPGGGRGEVVQGGACGLGHESLPLKGRTDGHSASYGLSGTAP